MREGVFFIMKIGVLILKNILDIVFLVVYIYCINDIN